jgi:SRSO17 transposase
MDRQVADHSESRFAAYVQALTSVMGHAHRAAALKDYCVGLLAAEGRKSVEPIAAVTAPAKVSAQHQKLLHFVANGAWSDKQVLAKVREFVLPTIERYGPIEAWVIDDTSFPKKGSHSVGAHHQYCGELGKQANCQVVVTLSLANHHASLPIGYQLYLPQAWTEDAARRKETRIPDSVYFKTKPRMALEQIQAACAAKVPRGVALMDSAYGSDTSLRNGMRTLELRYVVGIWSHVKVQAVGTAGERGPRSSVKDLALRLPHHAWRTITWREGSLRGPRMAWFPSSRHSMHRGLWISDLRTGDDSPLRNSFLPETHDACHSRKLPTRGAPNPTRTPRSKFDRDAA